MNQMSSCRYITFVLALSLIMVFSFAAESSAQIFGTNLEKGDKNFSKGNYQKAYDFYIKSAADYESKLGKTYMNTANAQKDAIKLAEAYYKTGLSIKKLRPKDPAAKAMFEKASKASREITQGYYVKEEIKVPAGYVDRWIPATTKQVYVDGSYQDVYVEGGTRDVFVEGHYENKQVYVDDYKEVWVDPYYKQDGTYVKGHYRTVKNGGHYVTKQVFVDGYYKKEQLPGHYEKVWKDGYYKDVVIDAHYEKVFEPAHIEYKDIYKEKKVTIKYETSYIALAKSQLPKPAAKPQQTPAKPQVSRAPEADASVVEAPAVPAASTDIAVNDPAVKAAYERMTQAYQEYVKAGTPAEGPAFDKYSAALGLYQKAVEAAKK